MTDGPRTDPLQMINDIDEMLEQIRELGSFLGLLDVQPPKEEVAVDPNTHRRRARLARLLLDVRDNFEKLLAYGTDHGAPSGFDALLNNIVKVFSLLGKVDEARTFYSAGLKILKPEKSAWFLADSVTMLVGAYLEKDRLDEATKLYRQSLVLNCNEDAAIGLIRAAFDLISRMVLNSKVNQAQDIYKTMERFGGGGTGLALVPPLTSASSVGSESSVSTKASAAPVAPTGFKRPELTLVERPQTAERAVVVQNFEAGECDYMGIVRAQAAVNVISGFAMLGQVNKAIEVFESMPHLDDVEEDVNLRSMATVNLIYAYLHARKFPLAFELFRDLQRMGHLHDNYVYQATTVVEIIGNIDKQHLAQAKELYDSLEGLSDNPDFLIEKMRAAGNLVFAAGEAGMLDLSREIYDSLPSFGDSDEAHSVRASATVNLMTDYCLDSNVKEAEKLFAFFDDLNQTPEVIDSKVQAAFNLMCSYLRQGQIKLAEKLYRQMSTFGDTLSVATWLAHATFALISEYLKSNDFEKGFKAYAFFEKMELAESILQEQARAMFVMVHFCCEIGLRTKARTIYQDFFDKVEQFQSNAESDADRPASANSETVSRLKMENSLDFDFDVFRMINQHDINYVSKDKEAELNELLAQAACLLIAHNAQVYNFSTARELYKAAEKFAHLEQDRSVAVWILRASYEIVFYLVDYSQVSEAIRIFDDYRSFRKSPMFGDLVDRQILETGSFLIDSTPSISKVSHIYETMFSASSKDNPGFHVFKAARKYVRTLCRSGKVRQARDVHDNLTRHLSVGRRNDNFRVELAVIILEHYLKVGDSENAKSLIEDLDHITGKNRHYLRLRSKADKIYEKIVKKKSP
jgi:pentatricopeptide repeat protein